MGTAFSGRVVVVAGGTGGLGRAVSLAFLGEGANVVVTYRKQEELAALTTAAGANDGRLDGHEVDVTDEAAVLRLIESVLERHGRVDALVNAVGSYSGGKKLWEQDAKTLDRMLDLNLRSGYTLLRVVVPTMLAQGHGAIVNVAGRAALDHAAGIGAYAASKAAALAMMESLDADLKATGVRVNSILPGVIDTDANRKAMPKADFGKWSKPQDIARVVLFLCSEDSRVIRGAAVPVYGDS